MKKISCSALCVLFIVLACSLVPAYITGVGELLDAATLTEIDEIYYEMAGGYICLCHYGEQLPETSQDREGKEVAL